MNYSVVKAAGYSLMHGRDMVIHNGTTQTTERIGNPDSEYLKNLKDSLRSYEEVVNYLPNQVYIGNMKPSVLKEYDKPWYDKDTPAGERQGKFGEIMPQDEFIGMIKIVDVFDLVKLNKEFTADVKEKLSNHPLIPDEHIARLKEGEEATDIETRVEEKGAAPLYNNDELIGCVVKAHDIDTNLAADILLENLVSKASAVVTALNLLDKNNIDPEDIDYVVECSEEACGDMNQRGGGNFAKSIAEYSGLTNATGSDTRGFCAAPAHALTFASSLVKAGTFKNVLVIAGGSTAKLGMNGKEHVKKGMPILEDVVAGFGLIISENDGKNPVLRTDVVGRHTVGTGSSPQAVITSLVTKPLDKNDLKITDIDKYATELQNPDITVPAGAGNVPEANYKMIGALGVKRGELERTGIIDFIENHGMEGWAPTQGHIPSGVPYVGFARDEMLEGTTERAMIVGKGSLFLGRMTNLFDGISIVIEKNSGKTDEDKGISEEQVRGLVADAMKDFATHLLED